MQLVEVVQEILAAGALSIAVEQKIQQPLNRTEFSEAEIAAIDQLLEALCNGQVRSVE